MDIEIFPYRVLGSDTTEKLLNDLESLDDVKRTVIHGPRFPKGEATLPPQYRERRVITVNGEKVTGLGKHFSIDKVDHVSYSIK